MQGAIKLFRRKRKAGSSQSAAWSDVYLWMHCDAFNNSGAIARSVSRVNANVNVNTSQKVNGTGSFYFNNTPTGATGIGFSGELTLAGDFTIQYWIMAPNHMAATLGSNNWAVSNQHIQVNESDVVGRTGIYHPLTGWKTVDTGVSLMGAWHHLAYVRKASTVTVYADGIARGSFVSTVTYDFSNGYIGALGAYWDGGMRNAFIDEIAITNKAIYHSNFTPISNGSNSYVLGV